MAWHLKSAGHEVTLQAWHGLPEEIEVAEQPPKEQEDEDGGEAATPELLRAPTGRDTSQQLTHRAALLEVSARNTLQSS
jgi:hypothetical protein